MNYNITSHVGCHYFAKPEHALKEIATEAQQCSSSEVTSTIPLDDTSDSAFDDYVASEPKRHDEIAQLLQEEQTVMTI